MPHGHCYLWQTPLVSLHVMSDAINAIAFFSIPIALLYFIYKRKKSLPLRLLLLLGSTFMLCGLGHAIDILTLWYPIYWVSGLVKAATAIIGTFNAFEVVTIIPYFLSLKDPALLEAANQRLEKTIAEKELATKELENSQRTFERAFQDAPTGMAFISIEGLFLKVNRPLSSILGYSKKELLSIKFQSITHPDDLEADLNLIEELVSGQRRFCQFEKRYIHKLGHVVPVQLNVALLRDSQNKPLYFIAHYQDITKQRQATEALVTAKRESEAASQAKSSFLAAMSHEIRTPMNAMIGMSELLADTRLDAQQQDFVEVINKSGNTLLTVINDILDFSKIESNKLELEMGRLDLYECTEDVLSLFSNQAEQKGISLNCLIEPASIPNFFRGDSVRLRQIMSNLVSNSLKFTETGEVSIRIRVQSLKEKQGKDSNKELFTIHCSIEDTGIGIPEDKRSRLFKSFSQVDASTTRRYGGTGLGLAICKSLIEMMGGEISVESQVGVGSTFSFFIQLEAYEGASQAKGIEALEGLRQKRLLVVNSNEVSRRYLQLQAESWDLDVEVADSAEAAMVQLFRSDPFDAIAIDETLTDMDNIQLALQIRNFPNYQTIPIILLQSRKTNAAQPLKMLNNKVRVLQKPTRRSHLYNALVELLLEEVTASPKGPESSLEMNENFSETKPLRILLTEDIPLNQKVALQMLSTYGYQADIANNGKEAVDALQKQSYDLVFMDVQMPEMDGLTATGQIRLNDKIQQPYIIAMTAHAMQGDREECLAAGMDDYIGKPIRKQDLAAAIQRCPQLKSEPPKEKSPELKARAAQLDKLLLLEADQMEWIQEAESTSSDDISSDDIPSNEVSSGSSSSIGSSSIDSSDGGSLDGGSLDGGSSSGGGSSDNGASGDRSSEKPFEAALDAPLYIGVDVEEFTVLDRQILEGVCTDPDFLTELCNSFLQDAPQRIEQLRQDLDEAKASAVRASAHALKSLSGCVGAMSLFQVCKFIEDLGKRDSLGSAPPLMQQVEAEYEKVKTALEDYKKNNLSEDSK